MLLDLINFSKLRRAGVYAILLAALFIGQDLLLARITLFGVSAMLIPAAVAAAGLFDGAPWGGFVGLAAGIFCDLGYAEHTILFTVLLSAAGFFSGVLGKYLLHKGFVSYMVLTLLTMAVVTFCQMFRFLFLTGTETWPVWRTGILQLVWSLVWAVPVYFPCRVVAARPLDDR